MQWLVPWYSIESDVAQVEAMEQELRRELAAEHPLHGLPMRTVGRRQDCDDVLFAAEDGSGRFAVVHLTWTRSPPDRPPWPGYAIHESFAAWMARGMHPDHEDFSR
jgi:hypothetical protein